MNILIVMNPEWGGVIPSIPLAKTLRNQGHRVLFIGPTLNTKLILADFNNFKSFIVDSGFEYFEVVPQLANMDFLNIPVDKQSYWYIWRHIFYFFRIFFRQAIDEICRIIDEEKVNLLLVDPFVWFVSIAGARKKIPTINLKTNLRSSFNVSYPPCTSNILPSGDCFSRRVVFYEWAKKRLLFQMGLLMNKNLRVFVRQVRKEGGCFGLRSVFSEYLPEFSLPEIVFCPKSFDFFPKPGRTYLGVIDETRVHEGYDWPARADGKKVVFCSMGTNMTITMYPFRKKVIRFFQLVLEALTRRQEYFGIVLAFGNFILDSLKDIPENVEVKSWVSQLAVLKRSSVMITCGGLGTIKECISQGVPMIVFPRYSDQPGNAARVVYHGIGERVDAASLTIEKLLGMLDKVVLNRERYVENMRPIQEELKNSKSMEDVVQFLESAVSQGRKHSPSKIRPSLKPIA